MYAFNIWNPTILPQLHFGFIHDTCKKKNYLHANTRYRASVTSYFLFCNVQLLITIVNHISNPKYKKKQKKFKGEKEKGKQNKKIASRPIPMNS